MGSSLSAVLEPLQNIAKSVGDGIKGVKLPDNPFKDVSLGNKGRNFLKGVSSGIIGPRKVNVKVSNGSLFGPRTYQTRSVSSTPRTASGFLGDFVGNTIGRLGRTGTKPIFSSNSKPSLFNRIKNKIKPNPSNKPSLFNRIKNKIKPSKKPSNTGTSNINQTQPLEQPPQQTQPLEQPPQQTQDELQLQIKGGSKKKPSENKKKPSEKKKNPCKKEKKPSENEKKPSKKEKKPSENEKKPSKKEKKPSENEKKPSKKEKKPSENEKKPSENEKKPSENEKKPSENEKKPSENKKKPSENEKKPSENKKKPSENKKKPSEKKTKSKK